MLHFHDMPVARLLYTLLLVVALPAAALFLLWRGRRHPGYRQHWRERFLGRLPTPGCEASRVPAAKATRAPHSASNVAAPGSPPLVWIHAVSVGETRAAHPLIEALLARRPDLRILLTHGTPTGRQTSIDLFGDRVSRGYLPYDLPWALSTFLAQQRPALGLLMETEVWPNLVAACAARQIPLCLINARLSERSAQGYRRLACLAEPAFASLRRALAQTRADADRLAALGTTDIRVTGNLKSDAEPDARQVGMGRAWRAAWDSEADLASAPPRPVWLVASTREGEDEAIIEAVRQVPRNSLLIWVPRHPHRVPHLERALDAAGLSCQRRTQTTRPGADTAVWIGDTLGELAAYIAAADVVFMGGSLAKHGGQNLLEPCAQGKPVLVGPHTYNFMDVTQEAVAMGAAIRVADGSSLGQAVTALLTDAPQRDAMGRAALALRKRHRGSLEQTVAEIADLLPAS